jgi:uncharacterized membrane protein YhiD involved in acid resistance
VTEQRGTEPLVSGLKKAAVHFSKAAIEVASGVGDLVMGIAGTVRPAADDTDGDADGPQKIDIE